MANARVKRDQDQGRGDQLRERGEAARERVDAVRERTRKRLLGLDRSGPPPPETARHMPLRPFTLPNAIGFVRIALIPVFLVLALSDPDGRNTAAALIFATISATDYLDGLTARLTGQYSRLGALLDPLTDRVLVVSGVVVCFHFELLPRWALAVLAGRELLMLALTQVSLKLGVDIKVNMLGRWAVWPTMTALGLAILIDSWVPEALLYLGLAMTLGATVLYLQDGIRHFRHRPSSST
ncbi:MAG: CDP-alcohol phosphatidyltransferase family protein [Actinomycetota bacterium]|nr:CDP-alcohol phosphatidyltransferase family protein [Actinomycetota bacterium]